MPWAFIGLLLAGVSSMSWSGPGQFPSSAGTLPAPVTGGLPAAVRVALEQAYSDAVARPHDAAAVGGLAMRLHAYEQLSSAREWYGAACALDPTSPSLAYLAGVVQAELGDHAAAAVTLRRALVLDPGYLPAKVRLADTLRRAGDLAGSRTAFLDLAREYPELAVAHHGLGHVAAASGDRIAAIEHYRRAIELVPQFGAAQYALALTYRALGDRVRAEPHLAAYRQHGNRKPALADPRLDRVRALTSTARETIAQAARLGEEGRLEESVALHLRALDQDPAAAQAHVNLISLYGRLGRPADAERHYRAAVALEASVADAHYNYGVLLATLGRFDEAVAAFRQAIDANSFHAPAHNNLASLLLRQGHVEAAAASYRQAIASDPRHRGARANLARLLESQGKHREAIEQLVRCLAPDDADTPRYAFALARNYARAGDFANARRRGEQALSGALQTGNTELAAAIRRELERLPR